jgi:hypothetical protein
LSDGNSARQNERIKSGRARSLFASNLLHPSIGEGHDDVTAVLRHWTNTVIDNHKGIRKSLKTRHQRPARYNIDQELVNRDRAERFGPTNIMKLSMFPAAYDDAVRRDTP